MSVLSLHVVVLFFICFTEDVLGTVLSLVEPESKQDKNKGRLSLYHQVPLFCDYCCNVTLL